MPYKSKRTRDLQGEVKAGSGISVIENTKPDGTKEYTITNGDPASAITVDGTGLSLISNVLRNTMAAIMGWSGDDSRGAINWTDDNGDTVLKITPQEELFIGDAHDNNDFIIKHINGENRLIRGTLQIAENINSTGGVSLNTLVSNVQTLADMANSAAQYTYGFDEDLSAPMLYSSDIQENIAPLDDNYYQDAEQLFEDNTYKGLKVLKSGLYAISIRAEFSLSISGGAPQVADNSLRIIHFTDGTQTEDIILITPVIQSSATEYALTVTYSGIIELNANDILAIKVSLDGFNAIYAGFGTYYDDPILSIQKVR
jgi:hypothetical protein